MAEEKKVRKVVHFYPEDGFEHRKIDCICSPRLEDKVQNGVPIYSVTHFTRKAGV